MSNEKGQDVAPISPEEAYQFGLLPLVIWREARNQPYEALLAVGWSIRNRISHPCWWGYDYPSVILHHWQYSSFNQNDPNSSRFPEVPGREDYRWPDCLRAALEVFKGVVSDPTFGATSYFDRSLDKNPPSWSKTMEHTADIGAFHFYRGATGPHNS